MKLKSKPTNRPQNITDILFAVLTNLQREFPFTQKLNSRTFPIAITGTVLHSKSGRELKD